MCQEGDYHRFVKVFYEQLIDRLADSSRDIAEQEFESVAVTENRVRAESPLGGQILVEESLKKACDGMGCGCVHHFYPFFKTFRRTFLRKRSLASSSNSAVARR